MEMERVERDLILRTLKLIDQYDTYVLPHVPEDDQVEVTLLINCLLSLLVVPKERWYEQVEPTPLGDLAAWGISENLIESWGRCPRCGGEPQHHLREFLRRMRNSVCHARIEVL